MFIGHPAVALATKPAAPRTSLGTLIAAATFLDLLWPIFLLLGVERVRIDPGNTAFTPLDFEHYPWTHSALMAVVWSLAFGGGYFLITRYRNGAIATAFGVFSHWLLDFLTHRPDLPLWPGGPKVGMGLWNSVPATMTVELLFFGAAVWAYASATRARDRVGAIAFWSLIAFLVLIHFANILGPPPPSAAAIPYVGLATWLFPLWGFWIDRHREARVS